METVIRRTSKVKHINSTKHQAAAERKEKHTQQENTVPPCDIEASPAELPNFDRFKAGENEDQQSESTNRNTLDNEYYLQDGHWTDKDGNVILFMVDHTKPTARMGPDLANELEDSDIFEEPIFGIDDFLDEAEIDDVDRGADEQPNEQPIKFESWLNDHLSKDEEWFPYRSKTVSKFHTKRVSLTYIEQIFLLDLIDNMPRLRISDDMMKVFLWIMRECGVPDVPTFPELRRQQSILSECIKIDATHHESSMRNHFYMIHPEKLLALVCTVQI